MKINALEEKYKTLEEDFSKCSKGGGIAPISNINELFLPKTPAKFELKGHKSTVTSVSFHPSFTQIATSS